MGENKVLIEEEEEEQVSGGASVEYAAQPMRIFCPNCKSADITAKSFAYNGNHQLMTVLHCNSCGKMNGKPWPKNLDRVMGRTPIKQNYNV